MVVAVMQPGETLWIDPLLLVYPRLPSPPQHAHPPHRGCRRSGGCAWARRGRGRACSRRRPPSRPRGPSTAGRVPPRSCTTGSSPWRAGAGGGAGSGRAKRASGQHGAIGPGVLYRSGKVAGCTRCAIGMRTGPSCRRPPAQRAPAGRRRKRLGAHEPEGLGHQTSAAADRPPAAASGFGAHGTLTGPPGRQRRPRRRGPRRRHEPCLCRAGGAHPRWGAAWGRAGGVGRHHCGVGHGRTVGGVDAGAGAAAPPVLGCLHRAHAAAGSHQLSLALPPQTRGLRCLVVEQHWTPGGGRL